MSSRMRTIEYILDGFLKKCRKLGPILAGTPSEAQLEKIRRDLGQMYSHLMIAEKAARGDAAFKEWTRANATVNNQQERYRALQSISNIRGNINRINKTAEDVRVELFKLLAKLSDIDMDPATAMGKAASKQVEKYTEAQAKGKEYERDAIDVADHLGGTIVMIVALAKLIIEILLSRSEKAKEQPQG